MRLCSLLLAVPWALCASVTVAAAVPPVPADVAALPSIELVLSRLGITATEYSTHLELDAPDVAAPGIIEVKGRSMLPGTTRLLLFRGGVGAPAPALPQPPVAAPRAPRPHTSRTPSPPTPAAAPMPVLLASWALQSDSEPVLNARYEVDARQWVTLIAQAQGRWYIVARDIKLGKALVPAASERSLP